MRRNRRHAVAASAAASRSPNRASTTVMVRPDHQVLEPAALLAERLVELLLGQEAQLDHQVAQAATRTTDVDLGDLQLETLVELALGDQAALDQDLAEQEMFCATGGSGHGDGGW